MLKQRITLWPDDHQKHLVPEVRLFFTFVTKKKSVADLKPDGKIQHRSCGKKTPFFCLVYADKKTKEIWTPNKKKCVSGLINSQKVVDRWIKANKFNDD